MSDLHLAAADLHYGEDPVRLPPERAGWTYTGLDVVRVDEKPRAVDASDRELLVLPLSGGCIVELESGGRHELPGRTDVFEGMCDFLFVPAGGRFSLASPGGAEIALPWAVADDVGHAVRRYDASDRRLEVRGAGRATRAIGNLFIEGDSKAHRLAVVEVMTPPGNWSSYPPHKHDDASAGGEDELEEIYYFRIAGRNGWGIHRTYTHDRDIDATVTVRDGDVFLVPRGYHGPCAAPPEFPMYYLNVLAGADGGRGLRYSDDPAYAWIRDSWRGMEQDPRAAGPLAPVKGAR